MRYKAGDIMRLLQEVAEKTDMTLDYASFGEIYSKMEDQMVKLPFKEEYLYKRVFLQLKKLKGDSTEIRLNAKCIEHVAKYLSYNNYDQFKKMQGQPIHPAMITCVGSWYSYVRCNSGEEYVLIAPVRIYEEGREIVMQLNGRDRTFTGKLKYEGNCIYCLLESKQDKNLHLVFNVGLTKKANVLQGIFSGISTAGDPIAGREVLVRQEGKLSLLKNARRSISELVESKREEEVLVGKYFRKAEQNILKGGKPSTFELDDLNDK
jgi:hypothetical protein